MRTYVLVATAQTILWHGQLSLTLVIDDSKVTPFLSFCFDSQNHNNIVPCTKGWMLGWVQLKVQL